MVWLPLAIDLVSVETGNPGSGDGRLHPGESCNSTGGKKVMESFYYMHGDRVVGPVSFSDLCNCVQNGNVRADTPIYADPAAGWVAARNVVGLFNAQPAPLMVATSPPARPAATSPRIPGHRRRLQQRRVRKVQRFVVVGALAAACVVLLVVALPHLQKSHPPRDVAGRTSHQEKSTEQVKPLSEYDDNIEANKADHPASRELSQAELQSDERLMERISGEFFENDRDAVSGIFVSFGAVYKITDQYRKGGSFDRVVKRENSLDTDFGNIALVSGHWNVDQGILRVLITQVKIIDSDDPIAKSILAMNGTSQTMKVVSVNRNSMKVQHPDGNEEERGRMVFSVDVAMDHVKQTLEGESDVDQDGIMRVATAITKAMAKGAMEMPLTNFAAGK